MKTYRVIISGVVQGVSYRFYTQDKAKELELSGWVRNLKNGDVEAVFQGTHLQIEKMIGWCYEGSPLAEVNNVTAQEIHADMIYDDFDILETV